MKSKTGPRFQIESAAFYSRTAERDPVFVALVIAVLTVALIAAGAAWQSGLLLWQKVAWTVVILFVPIVGAVFFFVLSDVIPELTRRRASNPKIRKKPRSR